MPLIAIHESSTINIAPTVREMLIEIKHVSKKIYEVGIHLDIPWEILQSIRMKERLIAQIRLSMLQKWSERECLTWKKLVIALVKAGTPEDVAVSLAAKKKHETGMQLLFNKSLR